MKSAKISFLHKNRLIIGAKPTHQTQEKVTTIQINSLPILLPQKVKKVSLNTKGKQKQNIRPKVDQLVQNAPQKGFGELKLRSCSSIFQRKAFHGNSQGKLHIKQEKIKQANSGIGVEGIIVQIIDQLRKKYIISQNHLNTYTIKKENLPKLLNSLVSSVALKEYENRNEQFSYLSPLLEEISATIKTRKKQTMRQKNAIHSIVMMEKVSSEQNNKQCAKRASKIEQLLAIHNQIKIEIQQMLSYKDQIQRQSKEKQETIQESMKTIEALKNELQCFRREKSLLQEQLERYRDEVAKIREASKAIEEYVYSQQNKLLIMASDQYKAIESEIYEYASYLQCNLLASGEDYEPITITCITNDLEEQLKDVNKSLIQRDDIDVKEKSKLMRDFLLEWMNRFKRKDHEQKELLRFKTKCVQNFINKMKRWLDNWTLKQQYLVQLRDQFSRDTIRLKDLIGELLSSRLCDKCTPSIAKLGGDIRILYDKIENNYKLGNSFY